MPRTHTVPNLYFYKSNDTYDRDEGYTTVITVAAQKKLFLLMEVKPADQARELYQKIGRPVKIEFVELLKGNAIRNWLSRYAQQCAACTHHLCWHGHCCPERKNQHSSYTAPCAPTCITESIPAPIILEHHHNVTLCVVFPYHIARHWFPKCASCPQSQQADDHATSVNRHQVASSPRPHHMQCARW